MQSAIAYRGLAQLPNPLKRLPAFFADLALEPIFTAVAFLTLIGGLASEKLLPTSGLSALLYTVAYITGGIFGLKAGVEALVEERTIDVDLLMVLAALGAAAIGAPFEGALLLFLFSLSNVLQDYAMDRTRNAISSLVQLRPTQARVQRGERSHMVRVEEVAVGTHLLVLPGDRIPLDGRVLSGASSVDQSSLTGESLPITKQAGAEVFAGTVNQNGSLEIEVTRATADSTLARLIQMVEEAQAAKARTQRFLEKAEQYYAVGVIGATLAAIFAPVLFMDQTFAEAFYRAMTLMVAASPCALVISTPATILSAIAGSARKGVLFKGGVHLEQTARVKVVAFDKTGTLTWGKPQLTDVKTLPPFQGNEDDLLAIAAAVEERSEHPLASAVLTAAASRGLEVPSASSFQATPGQGVRATVDHTDEIAIGSPRSFAAESCTGMDEARRRVERLEGEGKTAVVIGRVEAERTHILGVLAFADTLRPEAAAMVAELKRRGVERTVMLTGDNERAAGAIARQVGVDEFCAELLPQDKVRHIEAIKAQHGPVAMVGDGVNDAPALAAATVGIAMGAVGTDVALETADVVLMGDELEQLPYAVSLSRKARQTLIVNLAFSLGMIAVMVAAIFGSGLSLPLAVCGHEGGTVLVCLNGLRLLGFRV